MSTIFDSRKYIVLFTTIALALILWLTISFWMHAYTQRNDARNIQSASIVEDQLFELANSLSTERALMYQLVSARMLDQTRLQLYKDNIKKTEALYTASVNTNHQSVTKAAAVATRTGALPDLQDSLLEVNKQYTYIEELRALTLEHVEMPWNNQRTTSGMAQFKQYSDLIESVGHLREDIHFITTASNYGFAYQSSLKNSASDIFETTAQIESLLESVLLLKQSSDTNINTSEHATMLIGLNRLVELFCNDIERLNNRIGLDSNNSELDASAARSYERGYSELSARFMTSLATSDILENDLVDWLAAAKALHQLVETLYENSAVSMLTAVRNVEKKATINLIIDTALVLLCLLIAVAAILYFKRIHRQAHQDELTGLSNRRQFAIDLSHSIESAQDSEQHIALLVIDLDRFKYINDSMGHAVGDRLLQEVARRIKTICGTNDYTARLGGDEFAILKPCTPDTNIMDFAETVRQNLAAPFHIDGGVLQIGGSVGFSRYPIDAQSSKELMNTADLSMYCAKNAGRNKIVSYDTDLANAYDLRVATEADLQTALRERQFELYFQPKFNLSLGKVDSVETLVRWCHPERGMVPPDQFIPIAEECGLLPELGGWVLSESCRQASQWLHKNKSPLRVAVNVSAEQFLQPEFVQEVLQCLIQHNLPAQYLELEVTESVVMADIDTVASALNTFKSHGIKIALDDFGTGYSSLSYLQDLPLDTLKIDKSFIQKLETGNQQHESITEAITDLARNLGLDTVAEGVETDEQLSRVENLGISCVQGYYYSKPVPAGDITQVVLNINKTG